MIKGWWNIKRLAVSGISCHLGRRNEAAAQSEDTDKLEPSALASLWTLRLRAMED